MIRRFQFFNDANELELELDVAPAVPEWNPLFRAASIAHVQPLTLAHQAGRLDDETAEVALARAYAEGVIVGSPTPGLEALSVEEWYQWLLRNREKFAILRSIAEVKRNFDPDAEVAHNAHGSADAPSQ